MKGIIIYKTKYGTTKKYAQWLNEETGFEMLEISKAKIEQLKAYDLIILCGGIYAHGIAGLSFIKKNLSELSGKKILIFCNGASPFDQKEFDEMIKFNMRSELSSIPVFYGRGAWNPDAMSFVDRNLCRLLKKAVAKKDPADYQLWEKALMEAGDSSADWTDRKYLEPLLEEIRK